MKNTENNDNIIVEKISDKQIVMSKKSKFQPLTVLQDVRPFALGTFGAMIPFAMITPIGLPEAVLFSTVGLGALSAGTLGFFAIRREAMQMTKFSNIINEEYPNLYVKNDENLYDAYLAYKSSRKTLSLIETETKNDDNNLFPYNRFYFDTKIVSGKKQTTVQLKQSLYSIHNTDTNERVKAELDEVFNTIVDFPHETFSKNSAEILNVIENVKKCVQASNEESGKPLEDSIMLLKKLNEYLKTLTISKTEIKEIELTKNNMRDVKSFVDGLNITNTENNFELL